MNRSTLRLAIAILALITAAIHLFLGVGMIGKDSLGPIFLLNALGYLVLLAALWLDIPKGQSRLVHWVFMAFAAVTIIAYFVVNGGYSFSNPIGLITKLDELLLIVALYLHLRG